MWKVFVESISIRALHAFHDRKFQVGVPANLKLNAPNVIQLHFLNMYI